VEAALLHTGTVGTVTGFEAARRYGMKDVPAGQTVPVLILVEHEVTTAGFAFIERAIYVPQVRLINGVSLAEPVRAILDGVRRVRELDPVRGLLLECLESGLCTREELSAELENMKQAWNGPAQDCPA
jgi:hypothetical protein